VGSLKIGRRDGTVDARIIKGDVVARNVHGDVGVHDVNGTVDIATTSGEVTVRTVSGDVRANSATGEIVVSCVKGGVIASSASGSITLLGISGDVDASTASGEVSFKGLMRANGHYRLKSLSSDVVMVVQPDAPGFAATLMSYSGEIESDFPIKLDGSQLKGGSHNQRISGRYGDGQAQVTLDSFSGSVRIVKGNPKELKDCK
jgi:DUF4097 and DUF4098 domain-containing protein YvlB